MSETAAITPVMEGVKTFVPSYWDLISRRIYGPITAKLALVYFSLIILCATFVPFIANGSPFRVEVRTERGWETRYPLFINLTNIDLLILTAFACGIVFVFVRRRTRLLPPEERGRRQFKWFAALAAVIALAAIFLFSFRYNRLETLDYRDLVKTEGARAAVFPPIRWGYADQEPLAENLINQPPSAHHLLGTDLVGRDVLSRLLWSTRVVLSIGLIAEVISVVIGLIYGALMGYYVGKVDMLGMRFVEMVESIPTLFLIIIFVAVFGRQLAIIMVIIGLTGWTTVARYVRAEFLSIRRADFVQAAVAQGLPLRSILFRHIMPNALSSVLVVISFGVASAITSESTLSFLGLGLEPPTPSWGVMLNEAGNPAEVFRPWLAVAPGLMIFLTIFACNLLGESLRDALDPRLNKLE